MNLELALTNIRLEDEARSNRLALLEMRKFLAGALCAACGEPLGHDNEIIHDDDDRTMHAECEIKEMREIEEENQ